MSIINHKMKIIQEEQNVRVFFNGEEILLKEIKVKTINKIIEDNVLATKKYFQEIAQNVINDEDLNTMSITIVLHYLYIKTLRNSKQKKAGKSLDFDEKDLKLTTTNDLIFLYLKDQYPNDWMLKSSKMLGIPLEKLEEEYAEREQFYRK